MSGVPPYFATPGDRKVRTHGVFGVFGAQKVRFVLAGRGRGPFECQRAGPGPDRKMEGAKQDVRFG